MGTITLLQPSTAASDSNEGAADPGGADSDEATSQVQSSRSVFCSALAQQRAGRLKARFAVIAGSIRQGSGDRFVLRADKQPLYRSSIP